MLRLFTVGDDGKWDELLIETGSTQTIADHIVATGEYARSRKLVVTGTFNGEDWATYDPLLRVWTNVREMPGKDFTILTESARTWRRSREKRQYITTATYRGDDHGDGGSVMRVFYSDEPVNATTECFLAEGNDYWQEDEAYEGLTLEEAADKWEGHLEEPVRSETIEIIGEIVRPS